VQGSYASWKVLDFFSGKFQDLEGRGKLVLGNSWKLLLKVLESLEKYP